MRSEFAALAGNKGLQLEVEACGDRVFSDPALVGQVVRNLVANAIKYTKAGRVCLRCSHEQDLVRLQVIDTGVGIPAGELARIYDDFYQIGVSTNTSRDGYGLGLSIVSRIVVLLGLKIDVQSEVGRGTVFTLVLPASAYKPAAVEPAATARRTAETVAAAQVPILLVEDDARVRNATRMLLKVEGYDVTTAASLAEAVAAVAAKPGIRLLVTDYHLGNDDTGVQVITEVRARLGPLLPAILITGDTSSAMRDLKCDAQLRTASKPINPDELLGLVRELSVTDRKSA
jgi:two-component system CheB/CheR fusion protein